MELEELLPHRAPMIVLDKLGEFDAENLLARAAFTVKPSDVFYDENLRGAASYFALEYMAQTMAAYIGALGKMQDPQYRQEVGFVLGTRKLQLNIPAFIEGKTYVVEAKKAFFDSEMASFDCEIFDDCKNLCARATVNAFKPKDPLKFINQDNG